MSDLNNANLKKIVIIDGKLKYEIVNYVGSKLDPENGEVTLEMVISVLAEEFPELMLAVAEENFIRGYRTGLDEITPLNVE